MTEQKKYKIYPPVGNLVIPKEEMTEKELREFALELVDSRNDTWFEKINKDPIEEVVEWLTLAEYKVEEL